MKINLDIKTILILVLLIISLFFGYKWYFSGNNSQKDEINKLEANLVELQNKLKLADNEILNWENKYNILHTYDIKLESQYAELKKQTEKAEIDAEKAKADLNVIKKEIEITKNKINELKKNQANRNCEDLIISIKNKTIK